MIKYIAKPDTWFKEGTECTLVESYKRDDCPGCNSGLFRGLYIVGPNIGYDIFWHEQGYKEGDEVMMNEVCIFDEVII